jgi:UDP-2,3-diacylglucosamine hydrolase
MTTWFISDLHLQASRPELTRACIELLDQLKGCDALYILGDLFEAWIGDDDDAPWLAELAAALKRLAASGSALHFQHGNRDFLLGRAFADRCGMSLLAETAIIDLYGRPALLMHGDTLCTADRDYLAFRSQVRNPLWQQAVLAKPLAERRQLAALLRSESRRAGEEKQCEIMDVTLSEVERVMLDSGVDLLVHGHTHRPARHPLVLGGRPAERIVLGDWGHSGWKLRAGRDGTLALQQFPISA